MRLSTAGRAVVRRMETATSPSISRQQQLSFSTSTPRQLLSSKTTSRQNNVQTTHHISVSSRRIPTQASATIIPSSAQTTSIRAFHSSENTQEKSPKLAHNKEPIPTEAPRTDFSQMDMLGQTPVPSTSIDVCMDDGFQFNSGAIVSNGDGALLVGGEAFSWRPWKTSTGDKSLVNSKGQFELTRESLGILDLVWPRPDLLIIGMGKEIRPLSPETKRLIGELGMRVDVLDTRNAASQFNLLATERGVDDVAALLIPLGWRP